MARPRTSWRLPALIIGAGVLLALLAVLLAVWSKQLLKDATRYGCSERASWVVYRVAHALERQREAVAEGRDLPPEVAAAWFLDGSGRIVERRPKDVADPPEVLLDAAHDAAGDEPAPVTLRGPGELLAAAWVPLGERGGGARGVLVLWDTAALRRRLLEPLAESELTAGGYRIAFVEDTDGPDELAFSPKAAMTLPPPLSFWRVAVGLADPDSVRVMARVQTVLLGALAGWLLVVLAGGVLLHTRGARQVAERQAAREQFLARATHELQTPLALLRAAAESVQRGAVRAPEDLERCLAIVVREEERLTRGLRRLLRHLRLENRAGEGLELGPLAAEVEAAARELEPSLVAEGLALEVEAAAAEGLVAPRDLVADVLRELLGNATKHARGGARVRVAVRPASRRVRLVVEDDGPGVEPAARARLFEPRLAGERGGGLGLALVREGLELVGGSVAHEVPAAGGARFVVEVPCRRA